MPRTPRPALLAAITGDGKLLATGYVGGELRIWNAAARTRSFTLSGQVGTITALAFSRDAELMASGSDDGGLRLWYLEGSLDPDGAAETSAPARREGIITAPTPFNPPLPLDGHKRRVHTVAFSNDGLRLLSAADDGTARVWRTDAREDPLVLGRAGPPLEGAAIHGDGRLVVTVPSRGDPQVWTLPEGVGAPLRRRGRAPIEAALFADDAAALLLIAASGAAEHWRREDPGWTFVAAHEPPERLAPIVEAIAPLSAEARRGRLWSALGHVLPPPRIDGFARIHHDVIWTDERRIELWTEHGERPRGLVGETPLTNVAFNDTGDRVVTIGADATVRVWTVAR
ncbi:MAG: hypothetical protein KC636_30225 [Myxococcales bacterium]|nr:hypothetical protein [Myxococcales bacterium]